MTREDVKQQLAKHPLRWKKGKDLSGKYTVHTATITFRLDPNNECNYLIDYKIEEEDGYGDLEVSICEMNGYGEIYSDIFFVSSELPDAKKHSEEHRLNLVCSLLGIEE